MDTGQKRKEILRLLDEVEELMPQLQRILHRSNDPEAGPLLGRLQAFQHRAVRLREGTDCLPAADLGRKGSG